MYFICTETTNSEIYSSWKDRLIADYPYFDDGAKDSARFLFGVKNAVVEVYDGDITIDEFLADSFAEWDAAQGQIPEGSRNKTHVPLRRPDHQAAGGIRRKPINSS